jgi:membrane protein required for colicin V production
MVLDSIIVITCLLAFYRGWKKGIVSAVLSLVGVLLGTIISIRLSHSFATYIQDSHIINSQYLLPISFIVLFVATIFVFRLIINAIEGLLKMVLLGWANKLIGAALYTFFTAFFISALFWLGNTVGILTAQSKAESKGYPILEPIAPKSIKLASQYLPFCKDLYQKINNFSKVKQEP